MIIDILPALLQNWRFFTNYVQIHVFNAIQLKKQIKSQVKIDILIMFS